MLSEVLSERKTLDILMSLLEESKHLRRLQREKGGSLTTIQSAVKSLITSDLVQSEAYKGQSQKVSLTTKGRRIASYLFAIGNESGAKSSNPPTEASQWILLLLYSLGKIRGSTRLEKLLFLLKDKYPNVGQFYNFVPETYGPYSRTALEDARILQYRSLVEIIDEPVDSWDLGDVVIRKDYVLTDKGTAVVEKTMKDSIDDPRLKEIIRELQNYNTMSLTPLLNFIHEQWPQYCRD